MPLPAGGVPGLASVGRQGRPRDTKRPGPVGWSEPHQQPHSEADTQAGPGWTAARAVCRLGRPPQQQGGPLASSLTGSLSGQAPSPAASKQAPEYVGRWPGRRRAGAAPEEREAASTGGSCRFSSWEKPLTVFGERAEGIAGSGCRHAGPRPCGIPSYSPGRARGAGEQGRAAAQPPAPGPTRGF